jgi:hypothetical protein
MMTPEQKYGDQLDELIKGCPYLISKYERSDDPQVRMVIEQYLAFRALAMCDIDTIAFIKTNYDLDDLISNDSIMNAVWEAL